MDISLSSLSRIPLFAGMDEDGLQRVERCGEERPVRSRQIVFFYEQQHDHVFILRSGRVKLVRGSSSGREVIFALINPPDLFGETALFSPNTTYPYSCEALEDSVLLCFKRAELEDAIRTYSSSLTVLYQTQTLRRLEAETRFAEIIFHDVTTRLAHLLVNLSGMYGRATKVGTVLRLKITHQDLANLIGSTRETTTLILSEFRRRGLIDFAGRKIVIIDVEQLLSIEGATYLHKSGVQPISSLV